ncbi:MAG: hypothetical protein UX30_C0011G0004 [Candidatus Saccharibacteria bacterium GW2011_GWA2_46_10]|nr:MAG: hypothetical protein UX30_C0011G0004 [Candidatus Saccharibacteria bacterium GW2011_GWA2_46_10]
MRVLALSKPSALDGESWVSGRTDERKIKRVIPILSFDKNSAPWGRNKMTDNPERSAESRRVAQDETRGLAPEFFIKKLVYAGKYL